MALDLPTGRLRKVALVLLSLFFIVAGIGHFLTPDFYVKIMPPYLPAPLELVYVSGFFEVIGGIAVLFPATRSAAGWGLIALLVAVFPANLYMATNPERFLAEGYPLWSLYARLPFQALFIAWAYWATR